MIKKLLVLSLILSVCSCTKSSKKMSDENATPVYAQGWKAQTSTITANCYADVINGSAGYSGQNPTNSLPGTGPKQKIQDCIDIVSNGQIVIAAPGTYVENINFNGKSITVASNFINTGNPDDIINTIIDGNHNGSVVTIENQSNETTLFMGFTVTNGYTNQAGGGIRVYGAIPRLSNLRVINNRSI